MWVPFFSSYETGTPTHTLPRLRGRVGEGVKLPSAVVFFYFSAINFRIAVKFKSVFGTNEDCSAYS